jgi:hypothetical protein
VFKAAVIRNVFRNNNESLGQFLIGSLTEGTVKGDRRFYINGLSTAYPYRLELGDSRFDLQLNAATLHGALKTALGVTADQHLKILTAKISNSDIAPFAEDWILENHPNEISSDWSCDFDEATDEITIQIDGHPLYRTAAHADLLWLKEVPDRRLLMAAYTLATKDPYTQIYSFDRPRLFTYRMESGNAVLDAMDGSNLVISEFFPIIPLRAGKVYIDDPTYAAQYPEVKKAYRRLTGGSINALLDQLKDNADVDRDVDAVHLVKGINLNTPEKVGKEYLWNFFKRLHTIAPMAEAKYKAHLAAVLAAIQQGWIYQPTYIFDEKNPTYGANLPEVSTAVLEAPVQELVLKTVEASPFTFKLTWGSVVEEDFVGNMMSRIEGPNPATLAKVGDIEIVKGPSELVFDQPPTYHERTGMVAISRQSEFLYIYKQTEKRAYKRLTIRDLVHENYVYFTHAVRTTAHQAMDDEPDESGFIVPLHYPTWNELSLTRRAQLGNSSSYLVFNSYQIVKTPWYASGFFRMLLVIAAIALSVYTGGGSFATAKGILGANAAVGAALGASVASAAVVGAIANYLAATIVTQLISMGARKLLGEKWGSIIGAIAGFIALQVGTHFVETGNFNFDWGSLMRVDNLLKLTDAATQGYSLFLARDTEAMFDEMETISTSYEKEMEKIEKLTNEIIGMTSSEINPMMFTDAAEHFGESREVFLSRTLLTGSDIANLTHSLIENFADISLELPLLR